MAAVQRDAERPAEPREDEANSSPQGVHADDPEVPDPERVNGVSLSGMPAETLPRTAEEAIAGVAIPQTPVNMPSPDAEMVNAAAIGTPEPALAPGVSVGPEMPSPEDRWSAPPPAALALCHGEVPDVAASETHGAAEDHDCPATCAPAVGSMPPLPACPQCRSPQGWRVYGAGSGRIGCLACGHLFHTQQRSKRCRHRLNQFSSLIQIHHHAWHVYRCKSI